MHSGDVITNWNSLDFEPRFTATAANALVGYIAHDVGGHRDYGYGEGNDPEPVEILQNTFFQIESAALHTATARILMPAECPALP